MNKNQKQRIEQEFQEIEKTISDKRTPIDFQMLEKIISKWLLIQDKGLIKVLVGAVIANKLQADPVWLFIVAAPGGTKTELIRGLKKIEGIYAISDLTTQTFISGDIKNKNASLLLRLPRQGTILTYKDFTTVLTMHRDKQQAIISQLREIYDGYYSKPFGTGETKSWEGKMGFIAGVTSVIDRHYEIYAVLGERFIQYRPTQPDSIALAKKAMANSGGEKIMREEIQNAFADFLAGVEIPKENPQISDEIKNRIAHLATFCVKARSGIIRDGQATREIDLIPDHELPTRLPKQLITLVAAFSMIGNNTQEEDYELLYKIAMDSLPQKRRKTLEILIRTTETLDTADVAMEIGYPTNTTRRILEDLHGLALLDRVHVGKGYADKWLLTKYTRDLLEQAKPSSLRAKDLIKSTQKDTLPEKSDNPIDDINSLFDDTNQSR